MYRIGSDIQSPPFINRGINEEILSIDTTENVLVNGNRRLFALS